MNTKLKVKEYYECMMPNLLNKVQQDYVQNLEQKEKYKKQSFLRKQKKKKNNKCGINEISRYYTLRSDRKKKVLWSF